MEEEIFEIDELILTDKIEEPLSTEVVVGDTVSSDTTISNSYIKKEVDSILAKLYIKSDSTFKNFTFQLYINKENLTESEKLKINTEVRNKYELFLASMTKYGWDVLDLNTQDETIITN